MGDTYRRPSIYSLAVVDRIQRAIDDMASRPDEYTREQVEQQRERLRWWKERMGLS
jgi:hypothetical protein